MSTGLYDREMGRGWQDVDLARPIVIKMRRRATQGRPWYVRRPGAVRKRFATFDDAIHYAMTGEVR